MPAFWDPLIWWLFFKERSLKRRGFIRHYGRIRSAPYGYYLGGRPDTATPLMLVHGLALFPEWWSPLLRHLGDNEAICMPELVGFGRSPGRSLKPDAFTIPLFREQLSVLKKSLGWDKVILGGVSLGGWVCLDYALAYPDEVAGLILFAPAGTDPVMDQNQLEELRDLFDYRNPKEFARLINDFVLYEPRPLPWLVGYLAVKRARWNGHKDLLHNLKREDWIGERARRIEAPTGLIWGRQDKVFPYRLGELLDKDLPESRLFTLENAGHSYLFEQPAASCEAFMQALEYVRGKR
ncbi:MAG: alpha/beta hydrolase [Planctomycetes bacterium]|nr:alpha/beta hydrolase [Planctomycetota bacterium]